MSRHLLRRDMSEACLRREDAVELVVQELHGPNLIGSNAVEAVTYGKS